MTDEIRFRRRAALIRAALTFLRTLVMPVRSAPARLNDDICVKRSTAWPRDYTCWSLSWMRKGRQFMKRRHSRRTAKKNGGNYEPTIRNRGLYSSGRPEIFVCRRFCAHNRHSKTTWQTWRSLKIGPTYIKLGRRPAYLPEAIREWGAERVAHTVWRRPETAGARSADILILVAETASSKNGEAVFQSPRGIVPISALFPVHARE